MTDLEGMSVKAGLKLNAGNFHTHEIFAYQTKHTHVPWSRCERLRGDFTVCSYEEVLKCVRATKHLRNTDRSSLLWRKQTYNCKKSLP